MRTSVHPSVLMLFPFDVRLELPLPRTAPDRALSTLQAPPDRRLQAAGYRLQPASSLPLLGLGPLSPAHQAGELATTASSNAGLLKPEA